MTEPGESARRLRAQAIAALERGPLIQLVSNNYVAAGGIRGHRGFGYGTIQRLVDEGLAVRIGRGVVSCRLMREAVERMRLQSTVELIQKNSDGAKR